MILNIDIENFRSFKDNVNFSMIAESSKSKENNVFITKIGKDDEIRLLNSVVIFGANASGKSTMLRAMFEIINFITDDEIEVGKDIKSYMPFKFFNENKDKPVNFTIEFIGKGEVKYQYNLSFDKKNIINEKLVYFPNNKKNTLFSRELTNSISHIGFIGSKSKNKKIQLFHNQPMLSIFGKKIPDEIISEVYLYFKNIIVINATNSNMLQLHRQEINHSTISNPDLLKQINGIVKLADTGLNGVSVSKQDFEITTDNNNNNLRAIRYDLKGLHNFFSNGVLIRNNETLDFFEESNGTQTLFTLGGKLLQALENGFPIFVDELDTSLHPFLTKLLVSLFQNKNINKNNAQLIFTTHDINLLDRRIFRKDQIWFTEKNKYGVTEMFSLQDFTDVREDTPFDKWYLAGKFGAIPNIKSLENLFKDNDNERS